MLASLPHQNERLLITLLYSAAMAKEHPKSVRGRILRFLYERYSEDPLETISPEDLMEQGGIDRDDLILNIHYLADSELIELMMGYRPPLFSGTRISPAGIDLVEDDFRFALRFPLAASGPESLTADAHALAERLAVEIDLAPVDWETRQALVRDVNYLRDELSRPVERWRNDVTLAVLDWIGKAPCDVETDLPALAALRELLCKVPSSSDE